jgi:hypothetical protein
MILSGPFLSEEELARAIASLEARAELAEHNGLPRTARGWREAVENLRQRDDARPIATALK